jgi:hypothetical protein
VFYLNILVKIDSIEIWIIGLPAAIDRAVLLPSEQLEQKEQEDHILRRRNTSISVGDSGGDPVMFYDRSRTL